MRYLWQYMWGQTVLRVVLLALVLGTSHPLGVEGESKEGLGGWWVREEQGSGFGHLTAEVERQRINRPEWWEKVILGWRWGQAGIWMVIGVGWGWQMMWGGGSAEGWWLVIVASHQARTALSKVQGELWSRLREEAVSVSGWPLERVSWGRVATEVELAQALEPKEVVADEEGSQAVRTDAIERAQAGHQGPGEGQQSRSPAEEMLLTLGQVVEKLPIGTNQGLLHMLWMLVSGQMLYSRGAIFPALQRLGLSEKAMRRAWSAFAVGSWQIGDLLEEWQAIVEREGVWQEHQIEGYRVKAVDLTAFWRPGLQNNPFKHYHPQAGKALPAIVLGLVTRVGQVGQQRVPLPTLFVRADEKEPAESKLVAQLLLEVADSLGEKEVAVVDAGFGISGLQEAQVERYTIRLGKNATARRNYLPAYKGRGPYPKYGDKVRPLARSYKGKLIPATPPDRQESWPEGEHTLRAEFWDNLVLSDQKPETASEKGSRSFNIAAIYDPRYKKPLLLATSLNLKGQSLREIYRDRWPVEQIPLAAKQMLGAARQFVHATESQQRLPELSLFAGSVLTYVAAKLPPIPTGFWDRAPKSTPGRLRRALDGVPFFSDLPLPARIRKKASVTDHLPKGVLAHRRQPLPP